MMKKKACATTVRCRLGRVQCWWPNNGRGVGVSTSKAHYFLTGNPDPLYAPLIAKVARKGLALQTTLETLMRIESRPSDDVMALTRAFKKISLDLKDHRDFLVKHVEEFDRAYDKSFSEMACIRALKSGEDLSKRQMTGFFQIQSGFGPTHAPSAAAAGLKSEDPDYSMEEEDESDNEDDAAADKVAAPG